MTVEPSSDLPMEEGFISEEEGRRLYEERYGKDTKVEGDPWDLTKGDESPGVGSVLEALDKDIWANPPEVDTPAGSIPNVFDASELPSAADIVDYFTAADPTPADAETSI
jgi:hypothetical protein